MNDVTAYKNVLQALREPHETWPHRTPEVVISDAVEDGIEITGIAAIVEAPKVQQFDAKAVLARLEPALPVDPISTWASTMTRAVDALVEIGDPTSMVKALAKALGILEVAGAFTVHGEGNAKHDTVPVSLPEVLVPAGPTDKQLMDFNAHQRVLCPNTTLRYCRLCELCFPLNEHTFTETPYTGGFATECIRCEYYRSHEGENIAELKSTYLKRDMLRMEASISAFGIPLPIVKMKKRRRPQGNIEALRRAQDDTTTTE